MEESIQTSQMVAQLIEGKMQEELADIAQRLQALPPFAQLLANEDREGERERLRLQWRFADISIRLEQQKLPVGLSFTNKLCRQKRFELTKPTVETAAHSVPSSYLDYVPDLPLIIILSRLTTVNDVKSLFWALSDKSRIEDACCNQLRQCLEVAINMDSKQMVNCSSIWPMDGGYCHNPVLCVRCMLNLKGRCVQCESKTDVENIYSNGYVKQCTSMVEADTGTMTMCKSMQRCPSCNASYAPHEADEVLRHRDFKCACPTSMQGCIYCTRECDECANVGCAAKHHFQTRADWPCGLEWPTCEDCKQKHCCATFNTEWFAWDFCVCPKSFLEPPSKSHDDSEQSIWSRMRKKLAFFFAKS